MVGGLCSPCMNSCIDHDNIDRVGRCLRSYDGIFEYEREKEYFYLENSIRSISYGVSKKKTFMDSIKECRITRFLANVHSLLDDYGKNHALNSRSSIRVDKDYWYMRGHFMCDNNNELISWPCSSIFHVRSHESMPLNDSLSLTASNASFDHTGIEFLKNLLFKDCRDAREEFFKLRIKGKPSNIGKKTKITIFQF